MPVHRPSVLTVRLSSRWRRHRSSGASCRRICLGERIRDKFAASRRKGGRAAPDRQRHFAHRLVAAGFGEFQPWMGGNVPLGYDVVGRRLAVNEAEAKTVKVIFERYLELGCVRALRADLDRLCIRSKQRVAETGRMIGGGSFSRGALYYLLRNRVYRGEAVHRGVAHPGEHEAIIGEDLWEAVQAKLSGQDTKQGRGRAASGALLMGLIYDDRGNRMSPSHTIRKAGRYRYYVSQAVLQGRKEEGGSIPRIGADELEGIVLEAIRRAFPDKDRGTDGTAVPDVTSKEQIPPRNSGGHYDQSARDLVSRHVERIVVFATEVEINLQTRDRDGEQVLRVPLERRPRDRKEIIVPGDAGAPPKRLDRSLVLAVARGRAWVKALRQGEYADTAEIASKCDLSEAYVRRILRLAFLAPDIVESIAEGRQPRGLTLQWLLAPVPFAWAEQRRQFGFSI
jgi:site-specific DNA recombinase